MVLLDNPISKAKLEGGCQCGAVRYVASGAPLMTALCHCTMCRRANAAPAVAWVLFEAENVRFTQGEPATFASSPDARRGFCARCGTPLSFTASYIPGLIDLTVGSLDQPERVQLDFHYWYSKRLSWLHVADDLPKHPEFPPGA